MKTKIDRNIRSGLAPERSEAELERLERAQEIRPGLWHEDLGAEEQEIRPGLTEER